MVCLGLKCEQMGRINNSGSRLGCTVGSHLDEVFLHILMFLGGIKDMKELETKSHYFLGSCLHGLMTKAKVNY